LLNIIEQKALQVLIVDEIVLLQNFNKERPFAN